MSLKAAHRRPSFSFCLATCHLPLATCHLPLATCHLPLVDVGGLLSAFSSDCLLAGRRATRTTRRPPRAPKAGPEAPGRPGAQTCLASVSPRAPRWPDARSLSAFSPLFAFSALGETQKAATRRSPRLNLCFLASGGGGENGGQLGAGLQSADAKGWPPRVACGFSVWLECAQHSLQRAEGSAHKAEARTQRRNQ